MIIIHYHLSKIHQFWVRMVFGKICVTSISQIFMNICRLREYRYKMAFNISRKNKIFQKYLCVCCSPYFTFNIHLVKHLNCDANDDGVIEFSEIGKLWRNELIIKRVQMNDCLACQLKYALEVSVKSKTAN